MIDDGIAPRSGTASCSIPFPSPCTGPSCRREAEPGYRTGACGNEAPQSAGSAQGRASTTSLRLDAFTFQFRVMRPPMQLRSHIAREIGLRS